jgi:hypothetical protein
LLHRLFIGIFRVSLNYFLNIRQLFRCFLAVKNFDDKAVFFE